MKTFHFESRGRFQVSPEALWPLIADTPRLNRAIGLPPVEYDVQPDRAGGSRIEARIRLFGLPVARWTEHPFRWEAPRGYVVVREFHGGFIARVRGGVELRPVQGGTEVVAFGDISPRNLVGELLVRSIVGPRSVGAFIQQCRRFEAYLLGRASHPFPALAGAAPLPPVATSATDGLLGRGLDQRGVELLRGHLAEASDEEVVSMRPFELADRWGLDRRETLALFLHATTAGLLTMSWDVLCPNCRVGKAQYRTLRSLRTEAHCDVCNITFDARFDRQVEARFSVAPALRRVARREFCIGGPMNTPHVLAQSSLAPGQTDELRLQLAPGSYRVRASGAPGEFSLEARDQGTTGSGTNGPVDRLELEIAETGIGAASGDVAAGPVVLRLSNRRRDPLVVAVETSRWPSTVATAALISTLQEFRDLFSSEALAPGLQLGIESLAFMFTDLTGSTALYQRVGQARAFRLVQDQFEVLGTAIAACRGALVKTIGDAVMATFSSGADALAAGLRIQRDIRQLDAPDGVDTSRLVKVGLHLGPCVAVTLNDRLDYFGTTVNTAARIEHECRGGQILASLAVCQAPEARQLLEVSGASIQEEVVRLRGLAEPVAVYRITPVSPEAD